MEFALPSLSDQNSERNSAQMSPLGEDEFHIALLINTDGLILASQASWGEETPSCQAISRSTTFQDVVGRDAAYTLLYRCVAYGFAVAEMPLPCLDGTFPVRCLLHEHMTHGYITCSLLYGG